MLKFKSQLLMFFTAVKIRLEHGWTKHSMAINERGLTCAYDDPDATAWCWLGAIAAENHFFPKKEPDMDREYLGVMRAVTPGPEHNPINFNDHPKTTQNDMLQLVQAAIAYCQTH